MCTGKPVLLAEIREIRDSCGAYTVPVVPPVTDILGGQLGRAIFAEEALSITLMGTTALSRVRRRLCVHITFHASVP